MTVLVNGPDGANTLLITTGFMHCALSQENMAAGGNTSAIFTALMGGPIPPAQFKRAIATASLASINGSVPEAPAAPSAVSWGIDSVDADFDDESGQIKLGVELSVSAAFASATLLTVGYQVLTMVAVPV